MPNNLTTAQADFEAGHLDQAELGCREILNADPQCAGAYHLLGLLAMRRGRPDAATERLEQAVAADGSVAMFHCHLGVALAECGRLDEAVAAMDQAIALEPGFADAHYNRANVLRNLNRLEDAVSGYRAALNVRRDLPEVHFNLGNTLRDLGRHEEAESSFHAALQIRPRYLKALNNRGNVLRELKRFGEAEACFREALQIRPDYAEAHQNLGMALSQQNRNDEAAACYREALRIKPGFARAAANLSKTLAKQGNVDEAIATLNAAGTLDEEALVAHLQLGASLRAANRFDEALQRARQLIEACPESALVHNELGLSLTTSGELDQALVNYREAVRLRADFADAHNNMAVTLLAMGQIDEALAEMDEALRIDPQHFLAHMNRALTWLRNGEFRRGWLELEWRRTGKHRRLYNRPGPLWDGSRRPDGTILVFAEQGLGDTLHMIRYAPLVKGRVGKVVFECQKRLAPILSRSPGIDELIVVGEKPPPYDVQVPLASLPTIFDTTLDTVPAEIPYVFPDQGLIEKWRDRVSQFDGLKVGIVWQGNRKYAEDYLRSIPLHHFLHLNDVAGVQLISLQKGQAERQLLAELADRLPIIDFGPDFDAQAGPFMDSAAVMKSLDLVITPNTATVHLAGALGVPVWLALNYGGEWHWLENRTDSPWYPTLRVFRQPKYKDWDSVMREMADELRKFVAAADGKPSESK